MSRPEKEDPHGVTDVPSVNVEPAIERIPASKLWADERLQRVTDMRRAARMAAKYKPWLLGTLQVSRRADGAQHVMDGAHRVASTVLAGRDGDELLCLVYEGLTVEQEATMFLGLNDAKSVPPLDKFRVRVWEGDPDAVGMNAVLQHHGYEAKQGASDGCFMAVGELEKLWKTPPTYGRSSVQILDQTLAIITKAWGRDPDGVRAPIVAGVGGVVLRYGQAINAAKLANELAEYKGGPRRLIGDARNYADVRKGTVANALSEILVRQINRGRRAQNRLAAWTDAA